MSWIDGLLRPEAYSHPVTELSVIETHISWVILTGTFAYKIKKPVDLGFLDFSTLDARQRCAQNEVRLNSRLAPAIYLGVEKITGSLDEPVMAGEGELVDYAVKMLQFPQSAQLDRMLEAGDLQAEHIDAFAARIAEFHLRTPVLTSDSPYGTPEAVWEPVAENFAHIRDTPGTGADPDYLDELEQWAQSLWRSLQQDFAQRRREGWIRECHGDLHLRNLAWIDDEPVAFDCIEFNSNLSHIDVLCDIAFLVMDLQDREQQRLANRFLNAYLEVTGDYRQLQLLPYYQAYRALVRAKVTAIRLGQAELEDTQAVRAEFNSYLQLARSYGDLPRPAVIVTCGLSGSGKTTVSSELLECFDAIRLRSDVERKRLFGLTALQSGRAEQGAGIYDASAHQQTYDQLVSLAQSLLAAGRRVIVDAAALHAEQRARFRELARDQGCGFAIVECIAPVDVLRQRLNARVGDASDADVDVLEAQLLENSATGLVAPYEQIYTLSVDTQRPLDGERLARELEDLLSRTAQSSLPD